MSVAAEIAGFAVAVALALMSAMTAYASLNAIKRVAAVLVGLIAALVALALLGAPEAALIVGTALMFAYAALGVALVVRVQEAYGGVEVADLDAADEQAEPKE